MTEAEWLTCTDPRPMLEFLRGRVSERKLRLFAVACARLIWDRIPKGVAREAVEAAERCADGVPWEAELSQYCRAMYRMPVDHGQRTGENWFSTHTEDERAVYFTALKTTAAGCGLANIPTGIGWSEGAKLTGSRQPDLIRDIFGNPFRPTVVDPLWLTWNNGTIPAVARAIYDGGGKVEDHVVLAGLLDDSGCDDVAIMDHCHGPGPHVRGCWVIDMLVGKG